MSTFIGPLEPHHFFLQSYCSPRFEGKICPAMPKRTGLTNDNAEKVNDFVRKINLKPTEDVVIDDFYLAAAFNTLENGTEKSLDALLGKISRMNQSQVKGLLEADYIDDVPLKFVEALVRKS